MKADLKQNIYAFCRDHVMKKIAACQMAVRELQESANEETKSSAGDKYETGRAMAQLEMEKYVSQQREFSNQLATLNKISAGSITEQIVLGSLVETDLSVYFLAISIGEVKIGESKIFVISPSSPIGQKLHGLKAGDSFNFNNRTIRIININ
jgi:transcription elongation GreA/GreB family factor